MSRKQEIINPNVGLRLKSLLAENGISQKEFAEKFGYTEQHISQIVRGKRRLTYETAQRIVKEFPEYRVEWLICSDNYKNHLAYVNAEYNKKSEIALSIHDFLIRVANDIGYQIEFMPDNEPTDEIEDYDGNAPIYIVHKDGSPSFYLTHAKYDELRYGVFNYTVFLIRQIFGMEEDIIPDPYKVTPRGGHNSG